MPKGNSNIYTGKMCLDKLIFFHEKESHMGHLTENAKREAFHYNAVCLLKKIKAEVEKNEHA